VGDNSVITPGQTLHLILHAQPGGKATYSIGSEHRDVPMKETDPGVYTCDYVPSAGASIQDAPVSATYTSAGGVVIVTTLDQTITINAAAPIKPTITSPKPGDIVAGHVIVTGVSAPFATVLVDVSYISPGLGDVFRKSGKAASWQVQADETGHWQTEDLKLTSGGILATSSGSTYIVSAVVIDAAGQSSEVDSITFKQK